MEQVTPSSVCVATLQAELKNHPDKEFVDQLISGFTEGFDTGIQLLPHYSHQCRNNLSARQDPQKTEELIKKELDKGYLIGPFDQPPFEIYRINPISLAEKKYSNKKRLVVDMSAPHDNPDTPSLNSLISKEEFTLSYVKIDEAIEIIQKLGRGAWLCKTDLVDAFKMLPVRPNIWPFQGICWNEKYYFFTRLIFGCRSSPAIFNQFSMAIVWIAHHNYGISNILHILDDFLTIDAPTYEATRTMAILLMILRKLHAEYATHKTCGPATSLEYVGLWVDTEAMQCRLPMDKLERITSLVKQFLGKKKCTKRQLLSLLGHLAFASRVIPAGRSFMSRLFQAAHSVKKLHHRVSIGNAAKADLAMWVKFLEGWDGVSLFLDLEETPASDMELFTDASGTIGYGAFYKGQWFSSSWPANMTKGLEQKISISYQELYPIVVAALLWGKHWARRKIVFNCDNQGTVFILNKGCSKSPDIMKLMRRLTIIAATHSFSYHATYLPGAKNDLADALSRLQIDRFHRLAPHAEPEPCQLPSETIAF